MCRRPRKRLRRPRKLSMKPRTWIPQAFRSLPVQRKLRRKGKKSPLKQREEKQSPHLRQHNKRKNRSKMGRQQVKMRRELSLTNYWPKLIRLWLRAKLSKRRACMKKLSPFTAKSQTCCKPPNLNSRTWKRIWLRKRHMSFWAQPHATNRCNRQRKRSSSAPRSSREHPTSTTLRCLRKPT